MNALTSKGPAAPMTAQAGPRSSAVRPIAIAGDNQTKTTNHVATQSLIANNPLAVREARLRRQRLVEHLHRLGPSPIGHFLREVEVATGADVTARLERYAEIDPEFVRALGGDRFAPSLHCIEGGEP